MPDSIASRAAMCLPMPIMQAVADAESAEREALRFRPLASDEDRSDREDALARLAWNHKLLAAYNPGLIVKAGGSR
ncbi:hypothetical protein [Streptomyces sp. NPDC059828]|uniref:hypothetical protein n=1 Tax=Streptomyces sp. NPDC059828 TaxID=3346965 RepID=UPI00366660E4